MQRTRTPWRHFAQIFANPNPSWKSTRSILHVFKDQCVASEISSLQQQVERLTQKKIKGIWIHWSDKLYIVCLMIIWCGSRPDIEKLGIAWCPDLCFPADIHKVTIAPRWLMSRAEHRSCWSMDILNEVVPKLLPSYPAPTISIRIAWLRKT